MSDIGVKLGVEGEAQFKSALKDINTNLKTLGTEMKAVTSGFDKNDQSVGKLTAQNQVLNKQIDEQKVKLDALKTKLTESAKEYGENDARTQKWQQSVNLATADLNKMQGELQSNNKALKDADRGYNDAGQKLDEYGNVVAEVEKKQSNFGAVLKGAVAGLAAIGAAAGAVAVKLGKEVISAYADYEQLVGGIDTLFKDSSTEMQKYASNAYKTAGLSANDYMETVTSFSASLISSLGGDTEAAVKYADMAISDMSDNANKMGTDMSSIQNTYQGFAKQNYTMLDNLKLGYGGTKTEMERLLKDAEAISGIKYDISSYADVVSAIHVIQDGMGITGTTAKEAEHTISGSVNSMQAAAKNLLVGFGDTNADMTQLTQNLVDSFKSVVTNIVPVLQNITAALPSAFGAILGAIGDLLPTLLETAVGLFRQVLDTVFAILPQLIPVAVEALMTIADALINNIPTLISAALVLVTSLADGLITALPDLIPAAIDAVMTVVDTLIDNVDMLIDAAIEIVMALANGLIDALPRLIEKAPEIISKLMSAIIENAPKLLAAAGELIVTLIQGIITNLSSLGETAAEIVGTVVSGIMDLVSDIWEVGKDVVRGIWEGIKSMGTWLWDQVKGFFSGVLDKIKSFLGIKSPSRVFAGIGENMAAGLGVGFGDEMKSVAKQINNSIPTTFDSPTIATQKAVAGAVNGMATLMGGQGAQQGGTFIIQCVLKDGRVLAESVFDPLRDISRQRGVALA